MSAHEPDMEALESGATESPGVSLPFDVVTFLIGIWRRKMVLVGFTAAAAVIGYAASAILSTREYESTAVLLYTPPSLEGDRAEAESLSLQTLVDLFKTRDNLEAVREELKLTARIEAIGASTSVELRRNTTLLEVRTRWDAPDTAAAIANALYACFFESLTKLQEYRRRQGLDALQERLIEVEVEIEQREKELRQFVQENNVVDLEKETQWYIQQLGSLDRNHEDANIRLASTRKQRDVLARIVGDLDKSAREQSSAMAAQQSSVTEANIRIQRLRELIGDSRQARASAADLMVKAEDLKRAEKLRELDAISQADFDRITAEYERAKALAYDSKEIEQWKEEIKKLDQAVVPEPGVGATMSGDVMRSVMIKAIDLQLEETALEEQVRSLVDASARIRKRLSIVPQIKHAYAERDRRMAVLVAERQSLQGRIADIGRHLESLQIPFRVVAEGRPMLYPRRSNRKLIFAGILFAGSSVGGLLVILLELLDLTIKSQGSLRAALAVKVLTAVPHERNDEALLPGPRHSAAQKEAYRQLALALRRQVPGAGACVVVMGGAAGAGVSTVTLNLAAILQQRGDRVLVVDGHTQPADSEDRSVGVADFIEAPADVLRGLDQYLASACATVLEPYSLEIIGVDGIPRTRQAIEPEVLVTDPMTALMAWARDRFTIIMIDAPPLDGAITTQYLATHADAILYVVRAGQRNILAEKRCFDQVRAMGVSVPGAVLVGVRPSYLRRR